MDTLMQMHAEVGGMLIRLDMPVTSWCADHEAPLVVTQLLTPDGEVFIREICPLASRGCEHQETIRQI